MIDSVKVGEMVYRIRGVDCVIDLNGDKQPHYHAYVSHGRCDIQYRNDLDPEIQMVAVLHEILHVVGRMSGLEFALGENLEEQVVITFSHALIPLLRHNPELIKSVTEKANEPGR